MSIPPTVTNLTPTVEAANLTARLYGGITQPPPSQQTALPCSPPTLPTGAAMDADYIRGLWRDRLFDRQTALLQQHVEFSQRQQTELCETLRGVWSEREDERKKNGFDREVLLKVIDGKNEEIKQVIKGLVSGPHEKPGNCISPKKSDPIRAEMKAMQHQIDRLLIRQISDIPTPQNPQISPPEILPAILAGEHISPISEKHGNFYSDFRHEINEISSELREIKWKKIPVKIPPAQETKTVPPARTQSIKKDERKLSREAQTETNKFIRKRLVRTAAVEVKGERPDTIPAVQYKPTLLKTVIPDKLNNSWMDDFRERAAKLHATVDRVEARTNSPAACIPPNRTTTATRDALPKVKQSHPKKSFSKIEDIVIELPTTTPAVRAIRLTVPGDRPSQILNPVQAVWNPSQTGHSTAPSISLLNSESTKTVSEPVIKSEVITEHLNTKSVQFSESDQGTPISKLYRHDDKSERPDGSPRKSPEYLSSEILNSARSVAVAVSPTGQNQVSQISEEPPLPNFHRFLRISAPEVLVTVDPLERPSRPVSHAMLSDIIYTPNVPVSLAPGRRLDVVKTLTKFNESFTESSIYSASSGLFSPGELSLSSGLISSRSSFN